MPRNEKLIKEVQELQELLKEEIKFFHSIYECNTGLDCEECSGCDKNLEIVLK